MTSSNPGGLGNPKKSKSSFSNNAAVPPSRRRALIVHGKDAAPGRFPYFCTLDRYCAGALIAPDIILTAGHCKPPHLDSVQHVGVGTYSFSQDDDDDDEPKNLRLAAMVRHPDYARKGDDEFSHDFTILKLATPLTKSNATTVVRINRDDQVPTPEQPVTALGLGYLYDPWATTQSDDAPLRPTVLQQVTLNYLPSETCRLSTNGQESYEDRIDETHLCTYSPPHNDRDACAYDSGGPLVLLSDSATDDVLIALVSWGVGCADPDFPGVNARVSAVSAWIDDTVCRLSQQPPHDFACASSKTKRPATTSSSSAPHLFREWMGAVGLLSLCLALLYFVWRCRQRTSHGFSLDMKRRDTGETESLRSQGSSDGRNLSDPDLVVSYYDSIPTTP